jgi:hypothetical protein
MRIDGTFSLSQRAITTRTSGSPSTEIGGVVRVAGRYAGPVQVSTRPGVHGRAHPVHLCVPGRDGAATPTIMSATRTAMPLTRVINRKDMYPFPLVA